MERLVNNLDLFMVLREQLDSLSDSKKLFEYLKQTLDFNWTEETSSIFRTFCQKFCSNISGRWVRSNRTLSNFLKRNGDWLETAIIWPENLVSQKENVQPDEASENYKSLPTSTSIASTSSLQFTPRKPFEELCNKQKRRRVKHLSESMSPEEIYGVTMETLKSSGSTEISKIMEHLLQNPEDVDKVKICISNKRKDSTILYTSEKALALSMSLNLSKWQYINLRDSAIEQGATSMYPSYYKINQAKLNCYPEKEDITITEDGASIKLQALLNLTTSRLLEAMDFDLSSKVDLKLICKWGFDGASSQSNYKQKASSSDFDDSSIFMVSLVPIRLMHDEVILWQNDRPSSTFYCRPIQFKFMKECKSSVQQEKIVIERQIEELQPTELQNVTVAYQLLMTMIDGKITSYISETTAALCDVCKAKPSEMNNLENIDRRPRNEDMYQYGLSSLHAWIRCMECLLHIDEELVYKDRWGGLTILNVRNLTSRLLMNNSTIRELNAVDFKVSPDLRFVLLISDVRKGWRHARLARYHVYDVLNRNKIPISPIEDDRSAPLLQLAEWSPTGTGLVFVHDNDIYYKPRVLKNLVCRITSTGVPGVIFNGVPDFLYETEILRLDRALWFNSDGQHLMYLTYNDSQVGELKYPWYGLDLPEPPAYPNIRSLRYPKVGTNNPVVTVYVVSLKTPKFLFPHALQFTSQVDRSWYVRWASWISDKQVAVILLNRAQNASVITSCNALQYNCQDIIREDSSPSSWSALGASPADDACGWCGGTALLPGPSSLLTTAPVNGWTRVIRVGPHDRTPLTQGAWETTALLGWDAARRFLYVIGTAPERAGERHLHRIWIPPDGDELPDTVCLTCSGSDILDMQADVTVLEDLDNLTASSPIADWPSSSIAPHVEDGNSSLPEDCLYNQITFSKNFTYYVQECLGPGPPVTWVRGFRGERRTLLWDGEPLRSRAQALAAPQAKVFRVEVQEGRAARVRLLLPPGFRETDDLPLPLLLQIDASPGSQLVSEKFQVDWGWYLATNRNFIVAQIDARGSGYQGEELKTEVYQKLLSVDVEDQIAVLSYLRDNLQMVDSGRVGVWGRGYGAAVGVTLAAEDARNVTRCVAAVAPLADLRHATSYWAERYAGSNTANLARAPWRLAANLPPRRVLLAHATADLTHPHHALVLARALVRAKALYRHQIYPDEGHDFEHSSLHLHKTLEQFFDECFGPVEVADWDTAGGMGGFFPFRD